MLFVTAMVLVVVVIGLPAMKFVQKLPTGCPFAQSKTALNCCNPCIYRAVASPIETGDLFAAVPPSAPPDTLALPDLSEENIDPVVIIASDNFPETIPLRC